MTLYCYDALAKVHKPITKFTHASTNINLIMRIMYVWARSHYASNFVAPKFVATYFGAAKRRSVHTMPQKNPIGIMLKLTPREKPPKRWPIQKH